jgi:hypothetical protein
VFGGEWLSLVTAHSPLFSGFLLLLSPDDNIKEMNRDPALDTLLYLDGVAYVVEAEGLCWVKFEVKQVSAVPEKPHGLDYSLTLHDGKGKRLLGFDNAHAIREGSGPGARTRIEYDHRHKGTRVRFYNYRDAATLLEDFWKEVDQILDERSQKP